MAAPPSPPLVADASDADLIRWVRAGSEDAYAELFRRHRGVALGVARSLAGATHGDDLVAEAFARVLAQIRKGGGPETFFRSYLLSSVRRIHLNQIRATKREVLVETYSGTAAELQIGDGADARADGNAVAAAFAGLPERWRQVLWLGAVEGRTNDEIADLVGLNSNAVAALSFRAREGLRAAYLREHLQVPVEEACRVVVERLPAYLRGTVSPRRRTQVSEHLDECPRCAALLIELEGVSSRLALCPVPFALASLALGGSLVAPAGSLHGLLGLLNGPVKSWGVASLVTTAVAGAAGLVALSGPTPPDVGSPDPPVPILSTAGPERQPVERPAPQRSSGRRPEAAAGPPAAVRAPEPTPVITEPVRPLPTPSPAGSPSAVPDEVPAPDSAARVGVVRWQLLGGSIQIQAPLLKPGWTLRSAGGSAHTWDCPAPEPDPTAGFAVSRTTCTLDLEGANLSATDLLALLDLRLVPPV